MPTLAQTLDWHTMEDSAMLKDQTRYLCYYATPFKRYTLLLWINGEWYDDENAEGQPFNTPDKWAELKKDE